MTNREYNSNIKNKKKKQKKNYRQLMNECLIHQQFTICLQYLFNKNKRTYRKI